MEDFAQFPTVLHYSTVLPKGFCSLTLNRSDSPLCYLPPTAFPLAEHLRSSLIERVDLIIKKAKPKRQDDDNISQLDIHLKIKDFLGQMQQILEEPFPVQIKEKVCMLKKLFLIVAATWWSQPLWQKAQSYECKDLSHAADCHVISTVVCLEKKISGL